MFGLVVLGIMIIIGNQASAVEISVKGEGEAISVQTLLTEMLNRDALTRMAHYTDKQASSYDRKAKGPDQDWFANNDASQFVRQEKNAGRDEWVLIDEEGPGALVRWWITAPNYKTTFRIYMDGEDKPSFEGQCDKMIGGDLLARAPLSCECSRGRNLYLPIPYAKRIKVTCDRMLEQKNLYYQINYRTWPKNTPVKSLSLNELQSAPVQKLLNMVYMQMEKDTISEELPFVSNGTLRSSGPGTITSVSLQEGPAVLASFSLKMTAEDMPKALRGTLLLIEFDGQETVCCPVGDFFGSGVGVNPHKTRYTTIKADGTMVSYWPMPYKKKLKMTFINIAGGNIVMDFQTKVKNCEWTDDTLYFHCNWRQERGIQTLAGKGTKDWNYIEISGKGKYVGDVLTLVNSAPEWWGEGDEKIYVDGEKFPSHFGTGTEDYYGYAWGSSSFFESPFHAQPRAEGPGSFGNVTNLRYRVLDDIPFTKKFKFDIEVWHWAATKVDYAVSTYWYGDADSKMVNGPTKDDIIEEAKSPVSYHNKMNIKYGNFVINDFYNGTLQIQNMASFERGDYHWKDQKQLWWTNTKVGDKLDITVINDKQNPSTMTIGLTKAIDYGLVQFYLNDKKIGQPIDLYNAKGVIYTSCTMQNLPQLAKGPVKLTIEIVGKNTESIGTMFGMDVVNWK